MACWNLLNSVKPFVIVGNALKDFKYLKHAAILAKKSDSSVQLMRVDKLLEFNKFGLSIS